MKLTTKSEYACLALIDLTEHYTQGFIKIKDIAERKEIPQKYLEQILMVLNRARYVQSGRGLKGGYRLAKSPQEISVAEIIRLMDGALAPVESVSKYFFSHTPVERSKLLLNLFKDIRDYVTTRLEKATFGDLVKKKRK